MAKMDGANYVVTSVRPVLSDSRGVRAREGETCERVNPLSLPWLLDRGWIEPKPKPKKPKAAKKKAAKKKVRNG